MTSGLPRWTGEVWRAVMMLRLRLRSNESLGYLLLLLTSEASAFPWRKDALASGATQKAINAATGLEDITIPAGYTWAVLSYWWAFDQPIRALEYMDGQPFTMLFEDGYVSHYEHDVLPEYYVLDPTGASAHTHGYSCKNMGSLSMEGFFNAPFILVETGTERAEEKTVKCSFCEATRIVDRKATRVRCPECGMVTFYAPQLFGRKEKAITEVIE